MMQNAVDENIRPSLGSRISLTKCDRDHHFFQQIDEVNQIKMRL